MNDTRERFRRAVAAALIVSGLAFGAAGVASAETVGDTGSQSDVGDGSQQNGNPQSGGNSTGSSQSSTDGNQTNTSSSVSSQSTSYTVSGTGGDVDESTDITIEGVLNDAFNEDDSTDVAVQGVVANLDLPEIPQEQPQVAAASSTGTETTALSPASVPSAAPSIDGPSGDTDTTSFESSSASVTGEADADVATELLSSLLEKIDEILAGLAE